MEGEGLDHTAGGWVKGCLVGSGWWKVGDGRWVGGYLVCWVFGEVL